ncbi:chromosome partitioning protein ParA [Subtercola boreus]|uniref:Chromosome partitioning protein ParA n=1 Tax=Subtercola boreus TaxID=120213 RepID=A0A3E0WEB2_9MICO|nr:chromosome partitioning protein ParA [Subtercola boreus]RFA22365.1 hypothetical protein B7R24_04265 [Subtercola boreus]RFA22427.1 hypothetical protein B7R23_04260 [Subtercola boreus]RFA28442.1 hypothetical protein B7R25_04275 [Subtercola boreus]
MAIDKSRVLDLPRITASLRGDNSGVLRVDDEVQHISADSPGSALQELVGLIQAEAERIGRPVRVTVTAETGMSILLAGVDGSIEEESFIPFEEMGQPWPPDDEAPVDDDAPVPGDAPVAVGGPALVERLVVVDLPVVDEEEPLAEDAPDDEPDDAAAELPDDQSVEPPAEPLAVADEGDDDEPVTTAPVSARLEPSLYSVPLPSPMPTATPFAPTPSRASVPPVATLPSQRSEPSMPTPPSPTSSAVKAPRSTTAAPESSAALAGSRRDLLDAPSFLALPKLDEPAEQGFKGFMNHFGLRLKPGRGEQSQRGDIEEISRHFPAHRTISVINRKGGANKTPTVANLAAAFARSGGGGVLAWDNNETMGTLGWRTEQGDHGSTVLDVLANADDLLDARAEFGQMSRFVHHQQADKFDVLRSDEDPSGTHEMTAEEVDIVHSIAAKYYRLILMDSGNSDRAENWLRMIDHTDQLVVPTTTMEDRAQAALLTLQAVQSRSEKAAELAKNAVVIISEWQPKERNISERMAEDFRPYVRDVVIVPFDPALKAGRILHSALQPATRRAWLAAAASIARGL